MINNTPVGGTSKAFLRAGRLASESCSWKHGNRNRIPDGVYLKTPEATEALGISTATLYRRKAEGYFLHGIHYVTTGPTKRSSFLWNVEECRKVQGDWTAPEPVQ